MKSFCNLKDVEVIAFKKMYKMIINKDLYKKCKSLMKQNKIVENGSMKNKLVKEYIKDKIGNYFR